jgi:general secretion pathway protein E
LRLPPEIALVEVLPVPHDVDLEASLADKLINLGRLTPEAVAGAERIAAEQGTPLGTCLVELGAVTERQLAHAYARALRLPLALAEDYPPAPVCADRFSPRFLRQSRLIPIEETSTHIIIAAADPTDTEAIGAIEIALERPVRVRVAVPAEFEAAFDRLYGAASPERLAAPPACTIEYPEIHARPDRADDAQVASILEQLIDGAADRGARDIHIEPLGAALRIRCRIDGVLVGIAAPPRELCGALLDHIKALAGLHLAEGHRPQAGRIRLSARGLKLAVGVSILPTLHGESITLRLLDRARPRLALDELGFSDATVKTLRQLIDARSGLVLVAGPPGSGKSTTLYALLAALNAPERKLITFEDTADYEIEGLTQIETRGATGATGAEYLRAALSQDPDVLMIDEIRDRAAAEMAIEAARSGCLVLCGLQAETAASATSRLAEMGLPDDLVAHALIGVLAQRLVARICPKCRLGGPTRPGHARCTACVGRGTLGRLAIGEAVAVTPAIRRLILAHAIPEEIERAAVVQGMARLGEDGLARALKGEVTLDEALGEPRAPAATKS